MKRTLILLLLLLLAGPAPSQVLGNQQVSSTLTPERIGLDGSATLQVVVNGVSNVVDVPTPTIRPSGVQISPSGRQFSLTSVNGVTESRTTFSFQLTPLEKGRFIIDPVTVNVNGVDYTTTSHRLEVTDALGYNRQSTGAIPPWAVPTFPGLDPVPQQQPRGDDVILEAELEPEVVYKHQATIHTLRLLAAVRLPHDPRYSPVHPTGLVAVPFPQENSQEYRHGRGYAVTEAKTAFFPLTEGRYDFPASYIDINMGIFGRNRRLATEPLTLEVRPLPGEGRPDSFTGAVGEAFEISADLNRSQITAGQTVELRVRASGEGNLDLVPYPYLPDWSGVEKKQAEGSSRTRVVGDTVESERTYVFRLKIKEPGRYILDGISLAYFRPSRERYEVVKAPPLTLTVTDGTTAEVEQTEELLPEGQRPRLERGSTEIRGGHLPLQVFVLSGLLVLAGLLLAGRLPRQSGRSWRRLAWRGKPRDLEALEEALRRFAPQADRLSREAALTEAGWKQDQIEEFEQLKSEVAAHRFGRGRSGDESALLRRFEALRGEVKP